MAAGLTTSTKKLLVFWVATVRSFASMPPKSSASDSEVVGSSGGFLAVSMHCLEGTSASEGPKHMIMKYTSHCQYLKEALAKIP